MELTQVLIKPLVTEKASALREQVAERLSFLVHPDANKIEIKRAVEQVFNVTVVSVNVVNNKPRDYARGRKQCHAAGFKKAYVTLAAGNKIEYFEGA